MKTQQELRTKLKEIDHKSYALYKSLAGEYQFKNYVFAVAGTALLRLPSVKQFFARMKREKGGVK